MRVPQESAKIVEREIKTPRVDIKHPQVEGLKNRWAERRINKTITNLIYFLLREQGYYKDVNISYWGGYENKLNEKGILSLTIDLYSYAEGAAHGLTVRKSLTFNLEDGRVYALKDLFKPGSDYVNRISSIIKRQIKEKDVPLIADFNRISKDQDYYLTKDSLVIYFQLYEYTPYAYGIPEFIIPFKALRDIIRNDGPIGRLVR